MALLSLITIAALAVPYQLTYSGRLLQNGAVVNATLPMSFAIYNAETGGSALWSTPNMDVVVNQGIYKVFLGDVNNPITPNVFIGDNAYLEVMIDTETLLPRTKINSVGYALLASGLSMGGVQSVFVSANGNVGIGTTLPMARLQLAAGTSSNAALIISTGNVLTNKRSGAVENDGTYLYYTDSTPERYLLNPDNLTQEPTGFPNRTDTTLAFNSGSRQFTITGTNFRVYSRGRVYTKSTEIITIANTIGQHFIYYDKDTQVLSENTASANWRSNDGSIQIATVHWDGTTGVIGEERHGVVMDGMTKQYLNDTVGPRFSSGLAGTFSSPPNFSVSAGSFYDADILNSITAQTTCRVPYRNGANFTYTAPQSTYYLESGGIIRYDLNGTATNVTSGNYVAYWIFAANDPSAPIYALAGQRQDTSLVNAQNNNTYQGLTLNALPFQEMKLLYRVILRCSGTNELYQETVDYRMVTNLPAGTYVAPAHSALSGLGSDDHPQYALLAGRSASQNLIGSTAANGTLVLQGNAAAAGNNAASPNVQIKVGNSGQTTALTVLNNGYIGLGITTPSEQLVVSGSIKTAQIYSYEIPQTTYGLATTTSILDLSTIPNGIYLVTGHGAADQQYYKAYLEKSGNGFYTLLNAVYNFFNLNISGSSLRLSTDPAMAVTTEIHFLGLTTY
jgi:hypothetical protein